MSNDLEIESFPLLHLPYIAIEEVLSTLDPFDLINFSLIKSKTKRIVNNFSNHKPYPPFILSLTTGKKPRIRLCGNPCEWRFQPTSDSSKHLQTEYGESVHCFYEYSENIFEKFKEIYAKVRILRCQIEGVTFCMDDVPDENRLMIDWLRTQQTKYRWFEVYSEIDTDKDLKYLLETLEVSDDLNISSNIKDSFQADLPQNLKYLSVRNAKFIRLDQLLRLNSEHIRLKETGLTNQEISIFLKSWMASQCFLNSKYIEIGIQNETSIDTILQDIPHERVDYQDVRDFYVLGTVLSVNGGQEIKRNDGKTARIVPHLHLRRFTMNMYVY